MKKYLVLQIKRILRLLPLVLLVVCILFGGLTAIYSGMMQMSEEDEANNTFKVAIAGSTDDPFIEMGLSALQAFDSSRFAIEICLMQEEDAVSALAKGDIAAYAVVPEGFVHSAMYGEILPIKYVSSSNATGLVSILKDEITRLISDILVACQKGSYGVVNALESNDAPENANKLLNEAAIRYVEFVFLRSNVYSTEELGIANELGLDGYLFSGLFILFLMLICLPFAPIFVRRDQSLGRVLAAKRHSFIAQAACDCLAFLVGMLLMMTVVFAIIGICAHFLPIPLLSGFEGIELVHKTVQCLPIALMTVTMSFMLYELTDDLISGVLLQFFVILVMGFVSGCMYPVFFFPEAIQKIAAYLPSGIARVHFANLLTDSPSYSTLIGLTAYSLLFFAVALLVRRRKGLSERG